MELEKNWLQGWPQSPFDSKTQGGGNISKERFNSAGPRGTSPKVLVPCTLSVALYVDDIIIVCCYFCCCCNSYFRDDVPERRRARRLPRVRQLVSRTSGVGPDVDPLQCTHTQSRYSGAILGGAISHLAAFPVLRVWVSPVLRGSHSRW